MFALAIAALSFSARAAEKVELRAGEHAGYGRIAIQWPTPVTYQAKLEGQTLVIHFARPFTAQLNIINRNLDHYIANAAQSADGMTITAKLLRPVELKSETVDHNIIAIDLVQKIETLAAKPDAKMLAKGKLIEAPPPKTEIAKAEVAKTGVGQAAPVISEATKTEAAKPEPTKSAAPKAKPEQVASLQAPAQAAPLAVVPPAGVGTAPNPAAGEAVVASIAPLETKSAAPEAVASASQNTSPSGTVAPQLMTESGQTSLRFDWPAPTAAAVYRRSSALWLVFAAASEARSR